MGNKSKERAETPQVVAILTDPVSEPVHLIGKPTAHDDEVTQPGIVLANVANRELITIISNISMEAKEHSLRLESLYELLKSFAGTVPVQWSSQLITEFERHHEKTGENVVSLKKIVAGGS